MSSSRRLATSAFGVEPGYEPYRLRQARYYDLGADVAAHATRRYEETGRYIELLDVGLFDGVSRRYVEAHPGGDKISWTGVDIYPHGTKFIYKDEQWRLIQQDIEQGLPRLDSNYYDVVLCEQVLEHLHQPELAFAELVRVLRPDGLLIVGVPTFLPGVNLLRKHIVPIYDRIMKSPPRGHVQAFSLPSFMRIVKKHPELEKPRARGFRSISGGILRPLEYHRWWWQLNRKVGQFLPSLCTEIQVVAKKSRPTFAPRPDMQPPMVVTFLPNLYKQRRMAG